MESNQWGEMLAALNSAKDSTQLLRVINTARRLEGLTDEQYHDLTAHVKVWGDLMTSACRDLIRRNLGELA